MGAENCMVCKITTEGRDVGLGGWNMTKFVRSHSLYDSNPLGKIIVLALVISLQ